MFLQILSLMHNLTTMLFGIFISAFFLGVKRNSKNILTLFLLFCCECIFYASASTFLGEAAINRLYTLIVHLPLILFLVLHYKYSAISACISVFSAYLCCQISNWIGLFVLTVTGAQWCYYISRILTTCLAFFLLYRFVCHTTEAIFAKSTRELCIIGFLPTMYYIADYAFTKLSSLLYSGNKAVVEFMGFVLCISYLTFLFVYFREYENKQEIRQYRKLTEIQLLSIQKEIEQVKNSKHKLALLRHDMRHHLDFILTQLQNGRTVQAADYIKEISNAYDDTVITTYCRNEAINSVISIYQARSAGRNITLNCDISVDGSLPCSDIAICTILSNALENSMHALEDMDIAKKWIKLTIFKKQNHLLLQIVNPTLQVPKFVDGVPISDKEGHGIGVKSIIYYVEQLNGQFHFSVSNHSFILKIII
ncbi:MAG: ATP-binding protein [Lachnospiraceae bacterium]|nr:ATP-binding protein [Lachnospiraceae bacterium]